MSLLLAMLFITTVFSVTVKLLGGDAGAFNTDIFLEGKGVLFSIKSYFPDK